MKVLSLFSGIGGFDLGFQRAGMEVVGMVEIDKPCQDVLRRQFPGVPIYDDVREVGVKTHEQGSVDIICGGFPCQDVSVAGKRAGIAGERSGLWYEFARIIDEIEPAWVVIENVPGLLSSNRGEDFAVIVRWLAERGYGVSWRVLDAQYFGVAQRRRRVFIIGSLGNGSSAEVLFERESGGWHPAESRQAGEEIAGTVTPRVGGSGSGWARWNESDGLVPTSFVVRGGKDGGGKGYLGSEDKSLTLNASQPPAVFWDGGQVADTLDVSSLVKGQMMPDKRRFPVVIWEMRHASEAYRESGEVAPTLQARMGTGGNNVPLVGVHRLTPTECARLQGFPDDWNDWLSDSARYKQYGNAVAVPVAEWIGKQIQGTLNGT